MEETDKESKTESPTEKRLKDSVEDGNVPVSREVGVAASILAITAGFVFYGESIIRQFSDLMSTLVDMSIGNEPLSVQDFATLFVRLGAQCALLLAPPIAILVISAIASSVAQNEPRLVTKRITPQFSRISPVDGWKRLFSVKSLVEFLKSLAKIGAAGTIVAVAMMSTLKDMLITMYQVPGVMLLSLSAMVTRLLFWVAAVALLIAAVDFVWQRYSWWSDLKMSRQELKDEFKQSEGDPIIKSRFRSIGRSRVRNRMMKAVPTATLIVANPTHIAIALRYNPETDAAPVVVATGADIIALRIRAIAEDHAVPVFERIELARALYKVVKVDQIIPTQFYKAIAELIRAVYDRRAH